MKAADLTQCLRHLDAADLLLVDARDWTTAARLAVVIDRVRIAHGLAERAIDPAELGYACEDQAGPEPAWSGGARRQAAEPNPADN